MSGIKSWIDEDSTRTVYKTLNPLDMMKLREAVKTKKTNVVMRDKNFTLTYNHPGVVFYKPERGFVPCGYVSLARLERYVDEMEQ